MRIINVDIPEIDGYNDGLGHIKMDRMGPIVLITGKNGSGKTRLLNKIRHCIINKPGKTERIRLNDSIASINHALKSFPNDTKLLQRLKSTHYKLDFSSYTTFSEDVDQYSVIDFVPKSLDLDDCSSFPKRNLIEYAEQVEHVGIDGLKQGTYARIQLEQDRYYNSKVVNEIPNRVKENAQLSYAKLCSIIKRILGADLSRSIDGEAQLFGNTLGKTNLSDGQKVLLQFCLAIHSQGVSLSNLVLFMDEPENHIHPSILFEVLDTIRNCINNGQVWIATHSISLLSHFDTSYIWYMENGRIFYSGREPERVLKGLLGDEEQIERLADFLNLPSQMASNQFSYECLFQPKTIHTGAKDAQTQQIRTKLCDCYRGVKLRVLDFGSGKGRLADTIYYSEEIGDRINIKSWLDYIGYDSDIKDKNICLSAIERIYGNSTNRYFNDENELLAQFDEHSFDIVVMCNVLHEIIPNNWLSLFSEKSNISRLLKDNGILLIVEDGLLPIGEKAHANGFVVLQKRQIKKLFMINEEDQLFVSQDARNDGRLMAYSIPRQYVTRITSESRKQALIDLVDQAKTEIGRLRLAQPNYRNGKLLSFWLHQFANAQLCIYEL